MSSKKKKAGIIDWYLTRTLYFVIRVVTYDMVNDKDAALCFPHMLGSVCGLLNSDLAHEIDASMANTAFLLSVQVDACPASTCTAGSSIEPVRLAPKGT